MMINCKYFLIDAIFELLTFNAGFKLQKNKYGENVENYNFNW